MCEYKLMRNKCTYCCSSKTKPSDQFSNRKIQIINSFKLLSTDNGSPMGSKGLEDQWALEHPSETLKYCTYQFIIAIQVFVCKMEVFKVPHSPFLLDFIGWVLLHIWIKESYENNDHHWPDWASPWVKNTLHSLNKKTSNLNQINTWNAYQLIDCTGSHDLLMYVIEEGIPHNLHDGNNLPWWNCPWIWLKSKILEKSWYESSAPNFNVNAHRKMRITEGYHQGY